MSGGRLIAQSAEVIRPKLRFKPVRRLAKGRCHHAGVGDDHINSAPGPATFAHSGAHF
jgi:hypothetical protein